jgi:hypothetical protein
MADKREIARIHSKLSISGLSPLCGLRIPAPPLRAALRVDGWKTPDGMMMENAVEQVD